MRVSKRALPYFLLATLAGGVWLVHSWILVPLGGRFGPLVFPLGLLSLFSLAYLVPSWRATGAQWLQGVLSNDGGVTSGAPMASPVLLSAALDPLVQRLGVTHAWLLLRDPQANSLRPVALSGTPPREAASPAAWPADEPVLLHVQQESAPLLRSQLPVESALAADPAWAGLAAEALLPVRVGKSIYGLVALGPRHNRSTPSMQQVDAAVSQIEEFFTAIGLALASEALARERNLFKKALEEAVDGLIVADGQLCVMMMNRAAEQLTATPASEAIGKPISVLLGSDIAPDRSALANKGGQPTGRMARLAPRLPPDVLVAVAPLDLGTDALGHLFCLTREEPLPATHPQAAEILAEVSHELRAPLANIRVYTELLAQNTVNGSAEDKALQQEWLRVIEQETERMAEQMETFLNLTRLESGTFSVSKAPLSMAEVITHVVTSLHSEAARRGITVTVDAASDLPTVVADERLVRMIAHNLISNAIKFSKDGGAVRVALTAHQQHLQLEIEDQGIGIPSEALPKLFTKFFRVTASAERVQGTGLGLALVKEAVAAHGGQVQVESTLGAGSCFTVSFPVASEQELHSLV